MADPAEVLDEYIFGDIWNNYNRYEDEYDITFSGNEFLVLELETGKITNFAVSIVPGSLTKEEIKKLADEQEWEEEDVD